MNEGTLFLIAGARRTGTTLLNSVACTDPAANPLVGEVQLLTRMMEAYRFVRERFAIVGRDYFDDQADFRRFYQGLVDTFLNHARQRFEPARILILKSPELSLVFDDVADLCPEARFLISVRDPRDQVVSELDVGRRQIEKGMTNALVANRDIAGLARLFNRYFEPILEVRSRHPERFLIVRYEELVSTPDAVVERQRAFTGLEYKNFDPNAPEWPRVALDWDVYGELPSATPYYGKKIVDSRVGRHREVLSQSEIRAVDELCGELMGVFGYPASSW